MRYLTFLFIPSLGNLRCMFRVQLFSFRLAALLSGHLWLVAPVLEKPWRLSLVLPATWSKVVESMVLVSGPQFSHL